MPSPASLFLITGFLGSGKTTVLNGLLRSLSGRRVGVIVNEWGKIGVDGRLLIDPSGLGVVELAGGQIFCSCVSGSFIAAAARLASLDLDYLLVETSGLAKPSVLETIVAEAERRAEGRLSYKGMICVVDATRFATIRKAAAVVDEQAVYSDRFVVTKSDAASPAQVEDAVAILKGLKPGARVSSVVRGAVDPSLLEETGRLEPPLPDVRFKGWGAAGRPGTTSLIPSRSVPAGKLLAFLSAIAAETYRIKGFVHLSDGDRPVLVDCVGDSVALRDDDEALRGAPDAADGWGLALIWKGSPPGAAAGKAEAAEKVASLWEKTVGLPAQAL